MAPKLTELEGCLAADRGGVRQRFARLDGVKDGTKKDVYARLLKARRHIDAHPGEALDVKRLARVAGMSEHHFTRSFRQAFLLTPHRYLRARRLARAKELLAATAETVSAIAGAVGFQTPSAFASAFLREVGCSPSAYREAQRQK